MQKAQQHVEAEEALYTFLTNNAIRNYLLNLSDVLETDFEDADGAVYCRDKASSYVTDPELLKTPIIAEKLSDYIKYSNQIILAEKSQKHTNESTSDDDSIEVDQLIEQLTTRYTVYYTIMYCNKQLLRTQEIVPTNTKYRIAKKHAIQHYANKLKDAITRYNAIPKCTPAEFKTYVTNVTASVSEL